MQCDGKVDCPRPKRAKPVTQGALSATSTVDTHSTWPVESCESRRVAPLRNQEDLPRRNRIPLKSLRCKSFLPHSVLCVFVAPMFATSASTWAERMSVNDRNTGVYPHHRFPYTLSALGTLYVLKHTFYSRFSSQSFARSSDTFGAAPLRPTNTVSRPISRSARTAEVEPLAYQFGRI